MWEKKKGNVVYWLTAGPWNETPGFDSSFASFVILSKLTFLGLSVHIYKMEIVSVPSMLATVVNVVVGFISWPVTPGRIKVCCIHTSVPLWALLISGMMSEIREPNIPVAWDISCLWLRFFLPTAQWVQWVQVISFLLMDIFSLVPYLGNQGFLAYHSEKINLYWFFFFHYRRLLAKRSWSVTNEGICPNILEIFWPRQYLLLIKIVLWKSRDPRVTSLCWEERTKKKTLFETRLLQSSSAGWELALFNGQLLRRFSSAEWAWWGTSLSMLLSNEILWHPVLKESSSPPLACPPPTLSYHPEPPIRQSSVCWREGPETGGEV